MVEPRLGSMADLLGETETAVTPSPTKLNWGEALMGILGTVLTKDPTLLYKMQAYKENAAMDEYKRQYYQRLMEQMAMKEQPLGSLVRKEDVMQEVPVPQYEGQGIPWGPGKTIQEKTGERILPKESVTPTQMPNVKTFIEMLRPQMEDIEYQKSGETIFAGPKKVEQGKPFPKMTEVAQGKKEEVLQSDIGKLQHDKEALMKSGFTENHPVIKAIDSEMVKKSSTEMTDYQKESLEIRKQTSEENRLLREQMHKDNLAIRQAFLELAKNTKNRLPPSAQKDINTKTSELDRYINLIGSYKDEYGGSIIGGKVMTEIYSRTGGKKDRVNWWKDWLFLDNKVRHELFGATLTPNEQRAWDAVTISENTNPEVAKNAMQTRLEIARNALNREIEGYSSAGWEVNIKKKETAPVEKGVIQGKGWKATPIP